MKLRKPKAKKLPKKPKKNASIQVMENYLTKVREITKANAKAVSEYNKAVKKKDALQKAIGRIDSVTAKYKF